MGFSATGSRENSQCGTSSDPDGITPGALTLGHAVRLQQFADPRSAVKGLVSELAA